MLVVVIGLAALCAGQQPYAVLDLGTLGGPISGAFAVNNFGQVAGVSATADGAYHAFVFDAALTDVPPLPGQLQAHAFALGDAGQVAVVSYDLGEMHTHGLLNDAGGVTDLGSLAPRGMNQAGVVVGFISIFDANFGWVEHAAWWQSGAVHDLGTPGGHFSYAYAVNNANRMVGMFLANDQTPHAVLWDATGWHELGSLGGGAAQAYDINDASAVVGWALTASGQPHAFLFAVDPAGAVTSRTDLGVLGGGYSYAYGLNEAGDVVGTSDWRAFLWRDGTLVDLNSYLAPDSGWQLNAAWSINDQGRIAGVGQHLGQPRAFLLTPLVTGDLNCDGAVNAFDIDPFVLALTDPAAYAAAFATCGVMAADVNGDGVVNAFDIDPFVALLTRN